MLADKVSSDYLEDNYNINVDEWPPNQPTKVVNVALIHYEDSQTEQELIEISKRYKEGTPAVDKLAHHSNSRVTNDISKIFEADFSNSVETDAKPPKLILIEGAPGIGKTVLAKQIAYLWAKKKLLTNVSILFLLFLRDPVLQDVKSLEQFIQYLTNKYLDEEKIKICTKRIVKLHVGIVMDGFDEYPIKLHRKSFIASLIEDKFKVFDNSTVVITSRPNATIFLHNKVNQRVEILGFAQEGRDKYISESLKSPYQRKKLQVYLKCQPIINGLVYVPLHLAVLLHLFKIRSTLPETLTEMNQLFILHTIYRSLTKDKVKTDDEVTSIEGFPKEVLDIVKGLSKLAFIGLQNNQLVFSRDVITEHCSEIKKDIPGAFNGFGLLQVVQHFSTRGAGITVSFNFLHFTMQEFLAAFHVSDVTVIPYEQQLSLMEKTFWKSMYSFMWMMYVGLNGINSKTFVKFLYKAQPGGDINLSNDIKSDKIKCLYLFQCFMEAKSKEIPKEISSIFYNDEICFHGLQLLPHHISSLTLYISKYSMQLQSLNLRDCHIGDVGMSILEHYFTTNPDKATNIKHIDLFGNNSVLLWNVYCAIFGLHNLTKLNWSSLKGVNVKEIVTVMDKNMTIQSLNLSDNHFNDDDAERIAEVLSNNSTLQELDFSSNKITTKGAIAISNCVQSNAKLQHFKLSWNNHFIDTDHTTIDFSQRNINDTDTQIVTKILCKNETVTKLDLSQNRISDKGAEYICMCIESNKSLNEISIAKNKFSIVGLRKILGALQMNQTVQKLSISHYNISDDRVLAISEYLKNNSTLQELDISDIKTSSGMVSIYKALQLNKALQIFDISYNNTTHEEAIAIGECLKNNKTLRKLDMSHNQLSDIKIINIGKGLQINTMLQVLVISHNNITDKGAVAISECLKDNNTLQEFDISYNQVSDYGVANISEALQDYSIATTNKEIINEDHIKNSTLQKLDISHNNISSNGIVALCDYLKSNVKLQELTISWNDCKNPIVLDGTSKICNMSNLHCRDAGATLVSAFLFKKVETQILDISHNAISDYGAVAISEYLNNNNTLQQLDMSHNHMSGIGAIHISKALQINSALQELVISHNNISDDGAIAIGKILGNNYKDSSVVNEDSIQNSTLQKLNMSHNNISSKGIVALCDYLKSNITLKELIISWDNCKTPIVFDSIRTFCNMSNLHFGNVGATLLSAFLFKKDEIQKLDISHNAMSDDGAVAISEHLNNNNMLQQLDMSHNQVSDIGIITITKALLRNITLQILDSSHNNICDDGAVAISEYLKYNRTLLELNLSHNEITSEGIVEILISINSDNPLHTLNVAHNMVTKSSLMMIYNIYKKYSNMPSIQISYNKIVDNYQNIDTILVSFENDCREKFTTTNVKLERFNRRASYKAKVLFFCAIEDDFVKELDLSSHGITNKEAKIVAKALHGNKSLQKLDISNNNISDDGAIAIGKILNNYKDSSVVNEDSIQNSTLQKLNMSHNNISSNGIVALCDCLKSNVTLQELTISWNDCKNPIFLDGKSKICNMSNLHCRDVGATLVSAFLFKKVETRILDISHNAISDYGAVAISEYLTNNNTLQQLDMSHNQVSDFGAINISKALRINSALKVLVISHNMVSDDGTIAIGNILRNNYKDSSVVNEDSIQNSTLQKLNMSHNNISNKGIVALCDYLKSNVTLQKLTISWVDYKTSIVLDGTSKICNVSNLHFGGVGATLISSFLFKRDKTRILDISHNAISDDGAVAISEYLSNNNTLQQLDMSHNQVSGIGIISITKALQTNITFQILDVSYNSISHDGTVVIGETLVKTENPKLQKLNLSYNNISINGIVALSDCLKHKNTLQELIVSWRNCKDLLILNINNMNKFSGMHFGDPGATLLSAFLLQKNNIIQILDLSINAISDDGAVAISEYLKYNGMLQELNISHNEITSEGIVEILKSINSDSRLHTLNLTHNIVTKSRFMMIYDFYKKCNNMPSVQISYNEIVGSSKDLHTTLVYFEYDSKEKFDQLTATKVMFDRQNERACYELKVLCYCAMEDNLFKKLDISKHHVTNEGAKIIAKTLQGTSLQKLDISHNAISDDGAVVISKYLNNNNTLQQLDISHNLVSVIGAIHISKALQINSALQVLVISHNNISDDGAIAISECLKVNTTLKKLDISNNKITNDGIIKIAEAIKANTTLSLLDVSENIMDRSTEVARALSDHLKHNNTLQVLKISWNHHYIYSSTTYVYHVGMNNECYVDIVRMKSYWDTPYTFASRDGYHCKKVEFNDIEAILLTALVYGNVDVNTIRIVNNIISNSAALVISDFLKENKTIETLKLSKNTISTEAINQILKAIQTNTTLQILNISSNNISDDVAVAISEYLKNNNTLQQLDMSYNQVSGIGVNNITKALPKNITLQILDISHNDISDDGAVAISEYLNNNNSLQQLDMSHNHVSNFGIINISKALLTNSVVLVGLILKLKVLLVHHFLF